VLVVDKPLGPTSHDVVARIRRLIGVRRVGHTGTLDPLATGVLPLVVGRATRLAALLSGAVKEYVADVRFGASTPTYDAESRTVRDPATGVPVLQGPAPPEPIGLSQQAVAEAVSQFNGTFLQAPPAFSAKKIDGARAYKRARRNQPVAPRPVTVTVYAIALEDYSAGLARVRLSCSAGFYVRTFAHELGERLGCGAHLEALRRSRAGDFTLADAVTLDRLEQEGVAGAAHLLPMDRLLLDLPGVVLSERGAKRASHGHAVPAEDASMPTTQSSGRLRLLDPSGALLGIAESRENGLLHPVIVLV